MGLFSSISRFYAISAPSEHTVDAESAEGRRYYRRLAMQSFIAATFGYSLYYVCRTSLNVMKLSLIHI